MVKTQCKFCVEVTFSGQLEISFLFFLSQMHIDSHDALGVLNTLFEILAPSSLRPVDMLLRSMFVTPKTMVSYCFQKREVFSDIFHAKLKRICFSLIIC